MFLSHNLHEVHLCPAFVGQSTRLGSNKQSVTQMEIMWVQCTPRRCEARGGCVEHVFEAAEQPPQVSLPIMSITNLDVNRWMRSQTEDVENILLWAKAEASLSATCTCPGRLREIAQRAGTLGWVAHGPPNKWCNSASRGVLSETIGNSVRTAQSIGTARLYQ